MAQKFTVGSSTSSSSDRLGLASNSAIHLSDGTLVMLYVDPATSLTLAYSSDHATVNTISSGLLAGFSNPATAQCFTLVRDSADNLYVIGSDSASSGTKVRVQAWVKGAGYTWAVQSGVSAAAAVNGGATIQTVAATWCNTGGGTASKGHLLVTCTDSAGSREYTICDAGVPLAGTGTLVVNTGVSPTFLGVGVTGAGAIGWATMDIDNDGFGATSGLSVCFASGVAVGSWAVTSAGTLSTNTALTLLTQPTGPTGSFKFRVIRYAANSWAIVYPSSTTTGNYMIARYSSTAQITAGTDSGAPTSMPLQAGSYAWDALLDPVVANQIWVIAQGASAVVYRVSAAVGSAVTWNSAAVAEDTLSPWLSQSGVPDLRCVKKPTASIVDWQAQAQTDGTPTYALLGDYINFASAPSAPSISSPSSGAYLDATAGFSIVSTYNSTDGANQSAYAIRFKKSGAPAYSWLRASDNTAQTTATWNPISTTPAGLWTAVLPSTLVSNGFTYNLATASQEATASLRGPYASDISINAQGGPLLTVLNPSSVTALSMPTISVTASAASGLSIINTQFKVFSAAQYTAGGFDPASSASTWDSGVLAGKVTSRQVGVNLTNGLTYRFYCQVTETGPVTSAWTYTTATVTLSPPAQPTVSGATGVNPTTKCPTVAVTVNGRDNALTANQASIETDTSGWAAGANTTLTQVTAWAVNGTNSLGLTATAAGASTATTTPGSTTATPVTPNTQWTALATFHTAVTARACTLRVNWLTAAGAASGVRASDSVTVNDVTATSGTAATLTVVAPSDAAYATITVTIAGCAAGEVHHVDAVSLAPGTSTAWTRGGGVGASTALIEYSDDSGVTWLTVRDGTTGALTTAVTIPGAAQLVTVFDYEITPTATRQYRATTTTVTGGSALASAASTVTQVVIPATTSFWLLVPTTPGLAVSPDVSGFTVTQTEAAAGHMLLGLGTPIIVADVLSGHDGTVTFETYDAATYATLETILASQTTVFLSSPYGRSYYGRLGLSAGGSTGTVKNVSQQQSSTVAPYRVLPCTWVAQPRP